MGTNPMMANLKPWMLIHGPDKLSFACQAEDIDHAIQQCRNANPGDAVHSACEIAFDTVFANSAHFTLEPIPA